MVWLYSKNTAKLSHDLSEYEFSLENNAELHIPIIKIAGVLKLDRPPLKPVP